MCLSASVTQCNWSRVVLLSGGGDQGCKSDSYTAQLSQWPVYVVCAKSFAVDVGACTFPHKLSRQLLSHWGIL